MPSALNAVNKRLKKLTDSKTLSMPEALLCLHAEQLKGFRAHILYLQGRKV